MTAALPSPRTSSDATAPTTAPPRSTRRARSRPAPPRMAMYFSPDGRLHHTRCQRPLHFRGIRGELEGDFWCDACHEHVTLPKYAVSQIPVEREEDRKTVVSLVR